MNQISFNCTGHKNITSSHESTLEFTTDSSISLRGDCIIGVSSSLCLRDIPKKFKDKIQKENSKIKIVIQIGEKKEEIIGYGNPDLQLSDSKAMIIRKSSFICPRTLAIKANKAACDIPRKMVELLTDSKSEINVTIYLEE